MAIDFPASPTPGQVFQGYYWDNDKQAWRSETPSVGAVVTSTITPTGAKNGDLWYNTNDGTLYVYFDNGITAYWTEVKANSALTTTLGTRLTAVETGKANLSGGNTFSGNQSLSSGYITASNQPRFKAILGSDQTSYSTSAGAFTVAFNNVLFNVGNGYNSSTGNFTAPVSGYYLVSASFMSSASQSGFMVIETAYNGAIVYGAKCLASSASASSTEGGVSASSVMYLAANDYIQLRGYKSVGAALGNGGGASDWGESRNYFEAHLLS